jgi:Leucine-rich repeat (LRR) protein
MILFVLLFVSLVFGSNSVVSVSSSADCSAEISTSSFDALEALYNATNGWNWRWKPSLSSLTIWHFPSQLSTPCSDSWQGLSCSWNSDKTKCEITSIDLRRRFLVGSMPSELGNILSLTSLSLEYNHLRGSIPTEIGLLTSVTSLSLYSNKLSGPIPSELGNLLQLNFLEFNSNRLSGQIPSQLGNLYVLEALYLDINKLNGTIPSELGNLTLLQYLILDSNKLSGSIPSELGNLSSLLELYLSINRLHGPIPSQLGNLAVLEDLYLQGNLLSSTLPSELGNLVFMFLFYIYDNSLTGAIPSELANIAGVDAIVIYDNMLDGTIPSELGNLTQAATFLFYGNALSGTIPSELGNLSNMQYFYLNENWLDGSIPLQLGNLGLEELYLNENVLSSTIPSELGKLTHLRAMCLSDNALNGTIPTELGNVAGLRYLFLERNSLVGPIHSELIRNITNLEYLYLNDNFLNGTIPSELGDLGKLKALSLYNNSLVGIIPSELGNLVHLQGLELEENLLEGYIPWEVGNLVKLKVFTLNDNSLSGTVPDSIALLTRLQSVNVSINQLSGAIDVFCSSNFSFLQTLDLSLNQFTGTIPESVFFLRVLKTLILSQNCFRGSLPSTMCNNKLENVVLDLLTGNCAADNGGFQGFVLANYMTGSIPACIWSSSWIRTLHLLGNGLKGPILDLADNSVLSVLALGSNQLTGTIPSSIQRHSFAQLDLSINRLSGTLESGLLVNQTATVYDLSVNRLSGFVPGALYATFSAGVVNVLEGNLFGCQQNNIPPSDVNHGSYQCGSVDFEYSLLTWAGGFVTCGMGTAVIVSRSGIISRAIRASLSEEFYLVLKGPILCLAVCLFALLGFVTAKLSSLDAYTATHMSQYWWTSTVVYVHNWAISVFLFVNFIAVCTIFTRSVFFDSQIEDNTDARCIPRAGLTVRILAHSVNIIVVATVNAVYVLIAVGTFNSITLLAIQATLGVFKLAWSAWAIPRLLSCSKLTESQKASHRIFMGLFVFLGAPFASSFCESSSCFLYVLTRPAAIDFFLSFKSIAFKLFCAKNCEFIPISVEHTAQSRIVPPWIYSYQCSSAVITGYVPVLILSYLISGVIIPFATLIGSYGLSSWPTLMMLMPFSELTVQAPDTVLSRRISVAVIGRRMAIKYIINFAVMMTFGLAAPLLSVTVVCETALYLITAMVLLEKFIDLSKQSGLNTDSMRQEFWNSFHLNGGEAADCVFIVLGYVSVFWSLFAFDWIADLYGTLAGGLSMLVPLVVPTLIRFLVLPSKSVVQHIATARQNRQKSVNIEVVVVASPLILPQIVNDEFSA